MAEEHLTEDRKRNKWRGMESNVDVISSTEPVGCLQLDSHHRGLARLPNGMTTSAASSCLKHGCRWCCRSLAKCPVVRIGTEQPKLHYKIMKNCEYQQIDPQALPTPTPTPPPPHHHHHHHHPHHHGHDGDKKEEPKRPRRKWEVFPGKNRFYCGGRIIVARQSGVLPLTLGLILVTSGLFFIFEWVYESIKTYKSVITQARPVVDLVRRIYYILIDVSFHQRMTEKWQSSSIN